MTEAYQRKPGIQIEEEASTIFRLYEEASALSYPEEQGIQKPLLLDVNVLSQTFANRGIQLPWFRRILSSQIAIEGTSADRQWPPILFTMELQPLPGEKEKPPTETICYECHGQYHVQTLYLGGVIDFPDRKLTLALTAEPEGISVHHVPDNYKKLPSLQEIRFDLGKKSFLSQQLLGAMLEAATITNGEVG